MADFTPDLKAMLDDAIATGHREVIIEGEYDLESTLYFDFTGPLRLRSRGGARLNLKTWRSTAARFRSERVDPDPVLTACAEIGATSIEVDDASRVERGDLLYFRTDTITESWWNTVKQCVRRVAGVDGKTLYLDQPLRFPFTPDETTLDHRRQAQLCMSNIHIVTDDKRGIGLDGLIGSHLTDSVMEGPEPRSTANVLVIKNCTDTLIERMLFRRGLYVPWIGSASRRTTIRHSRCEEIRHPDSNGWAEDSLYEDIAGWGNVSIIQSHPAINPTFRRVNDLVVGENRGLGIRALGGTVEDCEVHHIDGEAGQDTQYLALTNGYEHLADDYERRITRFTSRTAAISGGANRRLVVRECDVPWVAVDMDSHNLGSVSVDPQTVNAADTHRIEKSLGEQWLGGVKIEPYEEDGFKVCNVRPYPAIQRNPFYHFFGLLYSSKDAVAELTTVIPVKLMLEPRGNLLQTHRNGTIRLSLQSNFGAAEAQYGYFADPIGGKIDVWPINSGGHRLSVSLENPQPHFRPQILDEGGDWVDGTNHWWTFDAVVTMEKRRDIRRLDIEVKEWAGGVS